VNFGFRDGDERADRRRVYRPAGCRDGGSGQSGDVAGTEHRCRQTGAADVVGVPGVGIEIMDKHDRLSDQQDASHECRYGM
jgi:hypothetical protein